MSEESRISYEEFLLHAKSLVKLSNKLCDDWTIEINNAGTIYLSKSFYKQIKNKEVELEEGSAAFTILKYELNVYYSTSYNVPVFCFNVWQNNGSLLKFEELMDLSILRNIKEEELYTTITQQEHPLLFRPYYTVHPCRTHEVLGPMLAGSKNPLVTFISTVGLLINISLSAEYANIIASRYFKSSTVNFRSFIDGGFYMWPK